MSGFVVEVARLRDRLGAKLSVERAGAVDGATLSGAELDGSLVAARVELESVIGGVAVVGQATGRWRGSCRRCLAEIEAEMSIDVDELFADEPIEGETYPIVDGTLDLAEMVRDTLVLGVPLAPLCSDACSGPDPLHYPSGDNAAKESPRDPRWAALDDITF